MGSGTTGNAHKFIVLPCGESYENGVHEEQPPSHLQGARSNTAAERRKFPIQEKHHHHPAPLKTSDISSVLGNGAFFHEMFHFSAALLLKLKF